MGQTHFKQAQPYVVGDDDLEKLRLSVIIPALNESTCIASALASVRSAVVAPVDVVVVDGGSTDDTVHVAQQQGAKVIRAERGRGRQLNAGWRASRGDWCLFLHSDSQLPPRYDEHIVASLRRAHQQQQQQGRSRPALWALPRLSSAATASSPSSAVVEPARPATARESSGPALALIATATITAATPTTFQACSRGGPGCLAATGASTAASEAACGRGSSGGSAWRCGMLRGGWGDSFPAAQWARRTAAGDCGGCLTRGVEPDGFEASSPPRPTWGAFATIHTDLRNPLLRTVLSTGVELRTRLLQRPYGDQALFVRRDILKACGGFTEWPLLEDLELVQRLSREQSPVVVDAAVFTSARRWQSVGFLRTTLVNQAILAAYAMGVPPETLARWYRDAKRAVASKT